MRTHLSLLGLLLIASLAPLATAATFCPEYNPGAIANCSISVDVEDRGASAPVPGTETHRQYVLGDVYVDYPSPVVNWFFIGDAPVPYSVGYVELTKICPKLEILSYITPAIDADTGGLCRVSWDTRPPSTPILA